MEGAKEIVQQTIERLRCYLEDLNTAAYIIDTLKRKQKDIPYSMVDASACISGEIITTREELTRCEKVLASFEAPVNSDQPF